MQSLLDELRKHGLAAGRFLGLLHVLIGRRITRSDGSLVSSGLTWREVASVLKQVRWDKEAVREVGLEPDALAPRDRHRYWYTAISHAGVQSDAAIAEGDSLAKVIEKLGYSVSPAPKRSA
ncbi:MAG: hypothetical protein U0746_12280 [Gemmataceae bacterium]